MPRIFTLDPSEYTVPSISSYRIRWQNIPDEEAKNIIAIENQYLNFHVYLLKSLRHKAPTGASAPIGIGLSVRAGALKTALLICGSIAEAALRSHAEKRNYPLPPILHRRTFGTVLKAWCDKKGNPHEDLKTIWQLLQDLCSNRNNVHLYRAIEKNEDFQRILIAEEDAINNAIRILKHLQTLKS